MPVDANARAPRLARRLATLLVAVASMATVFLGTAGAASAAGTVYYDCTRLAGGSYGAPVNLGTITQRTIVYNCPPLQSGVGYNVRYFQYFLQYRTSPNSYVMTYFPRGGVGIHPRIALGASTWHGSFEAHYYNDGTWEGYWQTMSDQVYTGPWRLGAEKLSSPLGSIYTSRYNIVFQP